MGVKGVVVGTGGSGGGVGVGGGRVSKCVRRMWDRRRDVGDGGEVGEGSWWWHMANNQMNI